MDTFHLSWEAERDSRTVQSGINSVTAIAHSDQTLEFWGVGAEWGGGGAVTLG